MYPNRAYTTLKCPDEEQVVNFMLLPSQRFLLIRGVADSSGVMQMSQNARIKRLNAFIMDTNHAHIC